MFWIAFHTSIICYWLFIMAHRWLQMASKHLVQLKIYSFSGMFLSSFFILVNESQNPQVWKLLTQSCFFFSDQITMYKPVGSPVFVSTGWTQVAANSLVMGVKWDRTVYRVILFHPFLYFLNISVDIGCCSFEVLEYIHMNAVQYTVRKATGI